MTTFVGINIRGPIQALAGFLEVPCAEVKIKKLQQRLAIIVLAVRRVEELA